MFDKFPELFTFNTELDQLTTSLFKMQQPIRGERKGFLYFALGKGYKTHKSILELCKVGHGQDAAILTRSLLDLTITTLYILKDDGADRVLRYFSYGWKKKKRMFDYISNSPSLNKMLKEREKNPKKNDLKRSDIEREAKRVQAQYNYDQFDWSGKKISEMADEVGLTGIYKSLYGLLSDLTHSSVNSIEEYITIQEDKVFIDTSYNKRWVEESMVAAFDCFSRIIDCYIKEHKLDKSKELDDLTKKYVATINGLKH